MLRRFSLDFAIFSFIVDNLLVAISMIFTARLRPLFSALPYVKDIPPPYQIPGPLYFIFPLVWSLALVYISVYDGRRNLRFWRELTSLSIGSMVAAGILAGVLYFSFRDVSRLFFVVFALLSYSFIVLWRVLVRVLYRTGLLRIVTERKVLIIGTGQLGLDIQKQIENYYSLGLRCVGFLDVETNKDQGLPILGRLEDAPNIVRDQGVDDVVITLTPHANELLTHLIYSLQTLPVKIYLLPNYDNLSFYSTRIEEFAGLPVVDLRAPALTETQRVIKRMFDLLIVISLIPIWLPAIALIALAVKMENLGDIYYSQTRVGENGRLFTILKFRTMYSKHLDIIGRNIGVNDMGSIKYPTDPRITPLGRVLRRTSLDELPQLFNIIRGEMSLVGPRPEQPHLVSKYDTWQYKRFTVPQGLTGWWQVNGRADRPLHLNTEDDLFYIQNYSVFLDLVILIKTIGVVIRGAGAY